MKRRQPKVHAVLRKTYSLDPLKLLGFVWRDGQLVKLGAWRGASEILCVRPLHRPWR